MQSNIHIENQTPPRLLSIKQVCDRVSLSRATVYLRVKSGDFPRPKAISTGRKAWLESDINRWILSHFEAGSDS